MVLRFIGVMYLLVPVKIVLTIIRFAFSEGWNASQNAYKSRFGHKLDRGVHSPMPLYGPCPQHAIFDVTNPAQFALISIIEIILKKSHFISKFDISIGVSFT